MQRDSSGLTCLTRDPVEGGEGLHGKGYAGRVAAVSKPMKCFTCAMTCCDWMPRILAAPIWLVSKGVLAEGVVGALEGEVAVDVDKGL